jgi:protein TonB
MIRPTDRQRLVVCWSTSILLHAGLLIFGVAFLIKPARVRVEAGKTSTEIELVIEPAPVSTPAPPPPPSTLVRPQLPPPPQPVIAVKLVKPEVSPNPEPTFAAPSSALAPPKTQPARMPAKQNAAPAHESSSASRGALQAVPDELHNEPPEYPDESRIAREQGLVILRVEVTAAGEPAQIRILESSGYFRLDQAARRAVQDWKFHPALSAGIPVSSEVDVPVRFKLQ